MTSVGARDAADGAATGARVEFRELAAIRDEVPGTPLLVASGATPRDMVLVATLADGVLVGTALKTGGKTTQSVEVARVRAMVDAAKRAWK